MKPGVIAIVIVLGAWCSAHAQDGTASAGDPQTPAPVQEHGGLVIEPARSPFVVAPEYKVTEVDGRTGQLAGAYAGWAIQEQLLVAGALYKLTNLSRREARATTAAAADDILGSRS